MKPKQRMTINTKSYKKSGGGTYARDGRGNLVPEPLDVGGCVSQLDNFIQVMGHPGFTEIDKAVAEAVLSRYEAEEKSRGKSLDDGHGRMVVKDPVRTADKTGDMTYAIMYGRDDGFAQHMAFMAEYGKGLFDGSFGFEGRVDMSRVADKLRETRSGVVPEAVSDMLKPDIADAPSVGLEPMGQAAARAMVRKKSTAITAALSEAASAEKAARAAGCEGKYAEMMKGDPRKAGTGPAPEPGKTVVDDVFG